MARISFITFGCTLNFSDTELMMGLLSKAGHKIVDDVSDAELVVVNSCTVKNMAESKLFKTLRELAGKGKKIVVAGCVAQAEQSYVDTKLADYSVIGTKQLNKIVHVVEETLCGNVVKMLNPGKNERLGMPKIRRNAIIGIIPISEGCLGNCTYCKARFARGKLVSYDPEEIVAQVISDVKDGCKEIWLTSQDCGAYGKDMGTDIVALLRAVCNVKGDFKVRLGMMNPNFALEYLDDLVELYKQNKGKLFWFIHVPFQSGNNRILGLMKRKYTSEGFLKVCSTFRRELPEMTIATDIICGFPTETKEEFSDSLDLVRTVKPDVLNKSRFWPRPGTEAAVMKGQLHGRETNERSRQLKEVFEKTVKERNKIWKGWTGEIIIDEKGEVGTSESWIGKNYAYRPVALKGKYSMGQKVKVKIKKAHVHYLEGVITN
jgi:MiaB-like tRNA modifying enzyme